MAKKKTTGAKKKGSRQQGSQKREALKRGKKTVAFAKRRADGTFKENDTPKRAIPADRRKKAKKTVKSGYGDQGDRAKKR
jgi:hypothetical protein